MSKIVHVDRTNLAEAVLTDQELPPLADGAVRLAVQSFAVTANNVTYALAGDSFNYWKFFPAPDGKGVVPMWGHAVVAQSNHAEIAPGERVHGYLPMGAAFDVRPTNVSASQFVDATAHRQPMSPVYNTYSRLAADPEHDPAREAERMLFGGLFKTGFLIEAMFRRENWHGAEALIVTSASSKTALGLASVTRANSPAIRRIGLTSPRNLAFVQSTGFYDSVIAYEALAGLPRVSSVVVDFAGDSALLANIHRAMGDHLAYSCLVGMTHVGAAGAAGEPPPGPAPILFFAPNHATASIRELGAKGFAESVAQRWRAFLTETDGVLRIDERPGLAAARDAFVATVRGEADPAVGIIIRP